MKKILGYMLKHYKYFILIVVFALGQIIADLTLPTLTSNIIDKGISSGNAIYVLQLGVTMLIFAFLSTSSSITAGFFASKLAALVGRQARFDLFKKTENFSLTEFDKVGTASLITRTTNDVTSIQTFLVMTLRIAVTAPLMCLGGVIMALRTNIELSFILFMSMPVIALLIFFIARAALPKFKKIQTKLDGLNRVSREHISGMRVIKAFRTTEYEFDRFDKANKELSILTTKTQRIMTLMGPGISLVLNFTLIFIMWFGSSQVAALKVEIGQIIAFGQYVMQITLWLSLMSMVLLMYPKASVSAKRISDVLDQEFLIKYNEADKSSYDEKKGYIKFESVTFYYPEAQEAALNDISFEVTPGKTTAIIGSTGSGKTTILNLIPRFYDVTSGRILVNGIDVRDYSKQELCDKIGYVPQKALLFSGTIGDNLKFGDPDATLEEMEHACEIAQASDFINSKPDNFDSHVSQGGTNFSGGQKQRLSIARALIKKPDIYIFDDSFSALDFKTDAKLRKALKSETKNSAVIVVAQRVSSIMDADQIVVLDCGRIVGKGSHEELMRNCDVYKEIAFSQLSKEELQNEK